jgi:hypothetical protein
MRTIRLLRRKAASEYLNDTHGVQRAPSTLAKLAVIGGGPVFRRDGRVPLYSTSDLDSWVRSILSKPMRSTSAPATRRFSNNVLGEEDWIEEVDDARKPVVTTNHYVERGIPSELSTPSAEIRGAPAEVVDLDAEIVNRKGGSHASGR